MVREQARFLRKAKHQLDMHDDPLSYVLCHLYHLNQWGVSDMLLMSCQTDNISIDREQMVYGILCPQTHKICVKSEQKSNDWNSLFIESLGYAA